MSLPPKHPAKPESHPDSLMSLDGLPDCAVLRGYLFASVFLLPSSALAQAALQNSLTQQAAAEARLSQSAESLPYTFKVRDLRMLVTPSLQAGWNGNINNSSSDPVSSFILQPLVQIGMTCPLTEVNLLSLKLGVGYDDYLGHPENSSWRITSGSALSFDVFVKDFAINLHDSMSYSRDSSQQPAVVNTSDYANFVNTLGITTTWRLRNSSYTLGFDHQNTVSPSAVFESQDNAAEMLVGRATFVVHPQVQAGLEATVSMTDYVQPVLNDNLAYSAGPFVTWQPGTALKVSVRGGYTYYHFDQTSTSIQTADIGTYYADVTVTHDVTKVISYSFSAGEGVSLGVQSDAIKKWYVRPNVTWKVFKHASLQTGIAYEHGDQGVGNISGGQVEIYDWLGFTAGLNWPVMKKLNLGLNYRLTLRSSDLPDHGYTQNVIGLQLTYLPK